MTLEEKNPNDGADEQMLGVGENEGLAVGRDEVKFIKGDHQNGDAKIDIGGLNGKAFTGMTKEELMKYANDPFWVRLRWVFFVAFWAIWIAMLVAAVLIIVDSPKCAAPEPLPWYKQGILAQFKTFDFSEKDLAAVKKLQATGAIYELPSELTYSVEKPDVEKKIEDLVAKYKGSGVNVILDVTANYVYKDSEMLKDALEDENKRSAFIWIQKPEVPNNWLSIVNGSAWTELQTGNFVLSQFGDGKYDLLMSDSIVKRELSKSLRHLIALGVKGVRLTNTNFFLCSKNIQDEVPFNDPKYIHTQYGFWTHSQTTFQEGLGNVLYEYLAVVKNASAGDAFLSVADDVVRPEVYKTSTGNYGIDMPIYGRLTKSLLDSKRGKRLSDELSKTMEEAGNGTWLQWIFEESNSQLDPSATELFMSLLPGVPVIAVDSPLFTNVSDDTFNHIKHLRESPSYMFGDFVVYDSSDLVAYSRIKSGSPGYFVVFNPTMDNNVGNFTHTGLPHLMTVDAVSANYNATLQSVKSKILMDNIVVPPLATMILTYVPVK